MKIEAWLIACALLTFTLPAHANDGVFGGSGADLVPIKEKRIKMVSEDIEIVETPANKTWDLLHWSIKATYVFENPTKEAITTTFGFPERTCDEADVDANCGWQEGSPYTFFGMKTKVDGKKVKMTTGHVDRKNEWAESIDRVHLFEVTIPAGKKVEVEHRYVMGGSASSMGDNWVIYVTETGALWNGPIGSARFTIKLLERPWGFSYPDDYTLEKFGRSKDGKSTEIIFAMKDWTPKQDLGVLLGSGQLDHAGCPSFMYRIYDPIEGEDMDAEDLRIVTEAFEGMSLEEVRRCRNLVYAHHGYTFKDKKLHDYFYAYQSPSDDAKIKPEFWGYAGAQYTDEPIKAVVFAPDPGYKPSYLTEQEVRWVKALKAYEKQLVKKQKSEKKKKKK